MKVGRIVGFTSFFSALQLLLLLLFMLKKCSTWDIYIINVQTINRKLLIRELKTIIIPGSTNVQKTLAH